MSENIVASDRFEQYLKSNPFLGKPENLYNPMNYIMLLGGKRLRPKLLLLAYQCATGSVSRDALQLALAIETFHNFSLVHDDIMDNAPLRRGKRTVHEEWNTNTAILAGDNLLIKCYDLILKTECKNKEDILNEFSVMAAQVCEGQMMDLNLPTQEDISEETYLQMIRLKTAVLPACALKIGAMAGGADPDSSDHYYDFGLNLGMAFQLQDDLLDTYGNAPETGKIVGGDILENKRTLLYLYAEKHLTGQDREELRNWYSGKAHDREMKIDRVRALFNMSGSRDYLNNLKQEFEQHALNSLHLACPDSVHKESMLQLFDLLSDRKS